MKTRVPPNNTGAEDAIISGMMLDADAASTGAELLTPQDFYKPANAIIFEAMVGLIEAQQPVDEITVTERLRSQNLLKDVGGVTGVAAYTDSLLSSANIDHHAQIVRNLSQRRQLIQTCAGIMEEAFSSSVDTETLVDQSEAKIYEIAHSDTTKGPVLVREIMKDVLKAMDAARDNKGGLAGVGTGFFDLDAMTCGLKPGDLMIVAGRPSMGKTAFALNVAYNATFNSDLHVVIFSLEMESIALLTRMNASQAGVPGQRLQNNTMSDSDYHKLAVAMGVMAEKKLHIDETAAISILEMRARCRRLAAKVDKDGGLGLIVIDYLQLMRGRKGVDNREREIAEISRGLKALAKELKVPVIALSQLNRAVEARADKRPMLSDLRESGAIEQDADMICFVYRDEYYNPESETAGQAEIIMGKNRNGPTGTAHLMFRRDCTKFENMRREQS